MIDKGTAALVLGLAGFFLGGAAYFEHFKLRARVDNQDEVSAHDAEFQGQFAARITALEQQIGVGEAGRTELAEANKRISALKKELADGLNDVAVLKEQISGLALRIQALEKAAKDH
jgi:hypothetical protein